MVDCNLLDAPLRLGIDSAAVFHPETQAFAAAIKPEVSALIQRHARNHLLVIPLALGGHVDHFAVYQAAISSAMKQRLAFYEDLPYAAWISDEMIRRRVRQTEVRTRIQLRPVIIRRNRARWNKQHGIVQYWSQTSREEAALITKFSAKYGGGERLWVPKRSNAWAWLTEQRRRPA